MLTIKNLKVSVEEKPILKGLDLKVKRGEIHAIMGPNGSGKSTLAYSLAGHPHYEVTGGSVFLDKKDLLEMSPDQRAQAGLFLAFQYPVSIAGVSVQNFLKAAYQNLYLTEEDLKDFSIVQFRKDVQKVAKKLGIDPDLIKRDLNEGFSGGEKKRVEVLQMAVLKPKYAILDETDSGLDIDSIKLVARGIKQTVKENDTGCLVITHYQRILDYLDPNFVHVVMNGKIVESGGPELVKKLEKEGYQSLNRES